jgi:hypothetical protein
MLSVTVLLQGVMGKFRQDPDLPAKIKAKAEQPLVRLKKRSKPLKVTSNPKPSNLFITLMEHHVLHQMLNI